MFVENWKAFTHEERIDFACFLVFFCSSLFLGWLLSLAYPEGIVNAETHTFYTVQDNFQWFGQNKFDWFRLYPYGAIMALCLKCKTPTSVNYWINTVLFSINSGLLFYFGRALFKSRSLALALATAMLLFEFVSMRMFFMHLHMAADALFGEVLYLSLILTSLGWLRRKPWIFIAGYGVAGLAAWIRPIGTAIFPVWICFALLIWWRRDVPGWKGYAVAAASIALMSTPMLLWSARNYCIYGYFQYMGVGGSGLLMAALPLLKDSDRVCDDPKTNLEFITSVRDSERVNFFSQHFGGTQPNIRAMRYESYFFNGDNVTGPFDYLAGLRPPSPERRWKEAYSNPRTMFKVDQLSRSIATRIILAHPIDFLRRVWVEYECLFSPFEVPPCPWDCFNSDPKITYEAHKPPWFVNFDDYVYPGRDRPDPSLSNLKVAESIGWLCNGPLMKNLLGIYYGNQLFISHFIFIGAIVVMCLSRFQRAVSENGETLKRISIVSLILFLTTASQYFVTACCEVTRMRYAVGSGDLELHLLFILGVFAGMLLLVAAFKERAWQWRSLTASVEQSQ